MGHWQKTSTVVLFLKTYIYICTYKHERQQNANNNNNNSWFTLKYSYNFFKILSTVSQSTKLLHIKKLIPRVNVDFEKIKLVWKQKKTSIVAMVTFVTYWPVKNKTLVIFDHYGVFW